VPSLVEPRLATEGQRGRWRRYRRGGGSSSESCHFDRHFSAEELACAGYACRRTAACRRRVATDAPRKRSWVLAILLSLFRRARAREKNAQYCQIRAITLLLARLLRLFSHEYVGVADFTRKIWQRRKENRYCCPSVLHGTGNCRERQEFRIRIRIRPTRADLSFDKLVPFKRRLSKRSSIFIDSCCGMQREQRVACLESPVF